MKFPFKTVQKFTNGGFMISTEILQISCTDVACQDGIQKKKSELSY